jgi:hypothetical protein
VFVCRGCEGNVRCSRSVRTAHLVLVSQSVYTAPLHTTPPLLQHNFHPNFEPQAAHVTTPPLSAAVVAAE